MSEERLDRIETRLSEGFRQVDERFREAARQARQEYDAISHAISEVQTFAVEAHVALRHEMTAGFAAVRQELADGLSAVRQELADGVGTVRQELADGVGTVRQELADGLSAVRQELAGGLKSARSETADLRRTFEHRFDRIEGKLDRVLATRPTRTRGRRRR
jgi:hypothetical protein